MFRSMLAVLVFSNLTLGELPHVYDSLYQQRRPLPFSFLGNLNITGAGFNLIEEPLGQTQLTGRNGNRFDVSIVTLATANRIFDHLRSQEHIPFGYAPNGCYARAHEMAELMEASGIICGKVFIEGSLQVPAPSELGGVVNWWYHVAPVIAVRINGENKEYALDPSIADRPLPVEDWYSLQLRHPGSRRERTYYSSRFGYTPFELGSSAWNPRQLDATKASLRDYTTVLWNRAIPSPGRGPCLIGSTRGRRTL